MKTWTYEKRKDGTRLVLEKGYGAIVVIKPLQAPALNLSQTEHDAKADEIGHLIAAAPNLLAALQKMRTVVAQYEDDGDLDDAKNAADTAIDKATGGDA